MHCLHTESGPTAGVRDAASNDAADMIAKAKAAAKVSKGPGKSVLHEVRRLQRHQRLL